MRGNCVKEISALIVVDMQNDFVTGALRNENAIKTEMYFSVFFNFLFYLTY